jgi:hypothetical protein
MGSVSPLNAAPIASVTSSVEASLKEPISAARDNISTDIFAASSPANPMLVMRFPMLPAWTRYAPEERPTASAAPSDALVTIPAESPKRLFTLDAASALVEASSRESPIFWIAISKPALASPIPAEATPMPIPWNTPWVTDPVLPAAPSTLRSFPVRESNPPTPGVSTSMFRVRVAT